MATEQYKAIYSVSPQAVILRYVFMHLHCASVNIKNQLPINR